MRLFCIVTLICLCIRATPATYYVSSEGNDNADGLSEGTAWKTITKVNNSFSIFKLGDKILFRRGDVFYGQLKIIKSGSAENPLTFGAYGTGEQPVITGFTTISEWVNEGNGIYSKTLSCESPPEMVTVNGVQYAMGRWPNGSEWAVIGSNIGVTSLTDPKLGNLGINWNGAELIVRNNSRNIISKYLITTHTGNKLTFSGGNSSYPLGANWGYFIQNDKKTLDDFGEWFFDAKTSIFYMFFGNEDPNKYSVKVSTIDYLVVANRGITNFIIEKLFLSGANKTAIYQIGYNHNNIIESCNINFCGNYGIYGCLSNNIKISNCKINYCNDNAICVLDNCRSTYISSNEIHNTGLFPGLGQALWESGKSIYLRKNDNAILENNIIINSGFNGIHFSGSNIIIRKNFIDNFCINKDDGAGIGYSGREMSTNMKILNNIIVNGIGAPSGKPSDTSPWVYGIGMDYYTTGGFEITNNIIANIKLSGISVSGSQNVDIINNVIFDCKNGIRMQELGGLGSPPRNIKMSNNIIFAKDKSFFPLLLYSTNNDFEKFGYFDNNYYARPLDNAKPIVLGISGNIVTRSLSEWQYLYNQDLNSKISPISLTDTSDISFYYNETQSDKLIVLKEPMIDVKGNKYVNSVTLTPFTSIILMVDPKPATPVIPVYAGSEIQGLNPSVLEISYNIKLGNSIPPASAFKVTVNGSTRSVSSVSINNNKVILRLSSPIAFGDVVTFSYNKPSSVPFIQSLTGGAAVSLTNKAVNNKLPDPQAPNNPPVISINNREAFFSGFVGELDASGTYDPDGDKLHFEWVVPDEIPVSSTGSAKIRFLPPVISRPQDFDFILNVDDGKIMQTQKVSFSVLPYKPELPISGITVIEASDYKEPNYPANIADGNPETKWSANGDNQWLLLTLARPFKISHLQLGFNPGQKNESYFDIYVSKDNLDWEPVLTKVSSCDFSGKSQFFDFPAEKTETAYSYVKLIGHGNASDKWNNYSEIKIFGNTGNPSGNKKNISMFPNPATDLLNVLILEPVNESLLLKIYDTGGALCLNQVLNPGINNAQIRVNLRTGIYLAQILLGSVIMFAQTILIVK